MYLLFSKYRNTDLNFERMFTNIFILIKDLYSRFIRYHPIQNTLLISFDVERKGLSIWLENGEVEAEEHIIWIMKAHVVFVNDFACTIQTSFSITTNHLLTCVSLFAFYLTRTQLDKNNNFIWRKRCLSWLQWVTNFLFYCFIIRLTF